MQHSTVSVSLFVSALCFISFVVLALTQQGKMSEKGWGTSHEDLLKNWRKQCTVSLWLSFASKYYFEKINNWLSYPSIVLSTISSVGIVGWDCDHVGMYVMSAAMLLAGILTTINKHLMAAEKSHEFYLRGKDYYALIRSIDYYLALDRDDRPSSDEVVLTLRTNLDKITDQQIDFPLYIIREYEKKFKPIESMFGDLETTSIVSTDKDPGGVNCVNSDHDRESGFAHLPSSPSRVLNHSNAVHFGSQFFARLPSFHVSKKRSRRSMVMMPYQLYRPECNNKSSAPSSSHNVNNTPTTPRGILVTPTQYAFKPRPNPWAQQNQQGQTGLQGQESKESTITSLHPQPSSSYALSEVQIDIAKL
jgi:hypothetical protein